MALAVMIIAFLTASAVKQDKSMRVAYNECLVLLSKRNDNTEKCQYGEVLFYHVIWTPETGAPHEWHWDRASSRAKHNPILTK